jgi:hypothetical protein
MSNRLSKRPDGFDPDYPNGVNSFRRRAKLVVLAMERLVERPRSRNAPLLKRLAQVSEVSIILTIIVLGRDFDNNALIVHRCDEICSPRTSYDPNWFNCVAPSFELYVDSVLDLFRVGQPYTSFDGDLTNKR